MTAKELKEKYITEEMRDKVGVINIGKDFWFHVHNDEEPRDDFEVAFHIREEVIEFTPSEVVHEIIFERDTLGDR